MSCFRNARYIRQLRPGFLKWVDLMALSVRAFSRAWRILVRRVDETVTDLGYERAKQTYCASGEPKIVEIRRDGDEIEPKPRRGRFRASRASAHSGQNSGSL